MFSRVRGIRSVFTKRQYYDASVVDHICCHTFSEYAIGCVDRNGSFDVGIVYSTQGKECVGPNDASDFEGNVYVFCVFAVTFYSIYLQVKV